MPYKLVNGFMQFVESEERPVLFEDRVAAKGNIYALLEGDDPSPFNFCKNCGGKVKKSVANEAEKWNLQGHCSKKCMKEWDSKHFGCCPKAKSVECEECDQAYECVEHGPTHLGYHKKTESIFTTVPCTKCGGPGGVHRVSSAGVTEPLCDKCYWGE